MGGLVVLAASTLVSEDLALVAAGVLVARGDVPFWSAVFACFAGIFVGDLGLYAAGRLGGGVIGRMVAPSRLAAALAWLDRNATMALIGSRFTPGLRLPAYVAAGLLRLPVGRFALILAIAAALWTPLLVGLSALFGDRLLQVTSFPLALAAAFALWRLARIVRFRRWEFWPSWAVYLPLAPYFLWLAIRHRSLTLFTAANPGIVAGGLRGESKSAILAHLSTVNGMVPPSETIPASVSLETRVARVLEWSLPVVLKPDVGERGTGVEIARSREDVEQYLERCPVDFIVQRFVPGIEAGVMYVRRPGESLGRIVSIARKVLPSVTGDGARTLRQLIVDDARARQIRDIYFAGNRLRLNEVPLSGERVQLAKVGSHCRGAVFLDAGDLRTPALEAAVDRLAKAHPEFYLGRFDVIADSEEAIREGRFQAIELNGIASEPAHIYDPAVSLGQAYAALAGHWRAAFEIGALNRSRGFAPMGVWQLMRWLTSQQTGKRDVLPMQEQYGG